MLDKIPSHEELKTLIGENRLQAWIELCSMIEHKYDMECMWNRGGKAWKYEYKYRRGGKTLCCLYAREDCFGFMIIFGKAERAKFEVDKENYSEAVRQKYDEATTFHDGKWMMFEVEDESMFSDFEKLLAIKRKPNKK